MVVYVHYLDIDDSNKCRPGYVGKYCRARCIYPYYGDECEALCNCNELSCDVATGCKAVDRGMVYLFTIKEIKSLFQSTLLESFTTNFNSKFM